VRPSANIESRAARRQQEARQTVRIAQIAPLFESVPPKLYGGTERVVSYLTEELVRQGHDVTLFASGDSVTRARLVASSARSLRLDGDVVDPLAHQISQLEDVSRLLDDFDILHFHTDYLHFPITTRHAVTHLTTLHGRLDLPDLPPLYRRFPNVPLVSISKAQRIPLPWVNWVGNIYHGLPADLLPLSRERGSYLAFVGRVSPEKRIDRAIEIARRAGMPIRIAAKVDRADREYHESTIAPLLKEPHVDWVGEVSDDGKRALLQGAYALLYPVDWPEPFGLALIESMSCGTPVVAFRQGSIPEVVDDGVTGHIVNGMDEAVEALDRIASWSREACRRRFEERFTAERMAREYVDLYRVLCGKGERLTA
jgi:glycosyltransferase involved in cell wall biosynthesis